MADARAAGNSIARALALSGLGLLAHAEGDHPTAERCLEDALTVWRPRPDHWYILHTLIALGEVSAAQGNPARAHAHLAEGLRLARHIGDKLGLARGLEGCAAVAAGTNQPARAAQWWAAAAAVRTAIGVPVPPQERLRRAARIAAARAQVGAATWAAAWTAGEALALDEAVTRGFAEALPAGSPH